MAENQQNTPKGFQIFFEGTPLAEMMRKMMASKEKGCTFSCAEIMAQMMKMCSQGRHKMEEFEKETQDAQTANR